jgi:hypothetical protein
MSNDNIQTIYEVKQNYAGKVSWKLDGINKNVIINYNHYNLKEIIDFNGSGRNLRQTYDHYIAYCIFFFFFSIIDHLGSLLPISNSFTLLNYMHALGLYANLVLTLGYLF